jgi:uncharacterized membrane protein
MGEQLIATFALLFGELLVLAVFAWMPVMRGERAFFGVRVDAETYRGEGRRHLRRYWQTLAAVSLTLALVGYLAASRTGNPLPSILACLAATAASFVIYAGYSRRLRPLAVESAQTRFASPLSVRRLADFTHLWVEASVVLLACGTFALLAYHYPRLPDVMPTHWNLAGVPDVWERKSLGSVFFPAALGAYLQLFFFVLKRDLVGAKMTLPAARAEEYLRGKERFLRANILLIDWVRLSIAALFFCIALLMITTAAGALGGSARAATAALLAIVALMLGGIFYLIYRMVRINSEIAETAGEEYAQRPRDERHWRHGGLTYYNPEDPALVVEKLVGLGYTVNLAHPGVRSRLALMAGIPVLVLWAVIYL